MASQASQRNLLSEDDLERMVNDTITYVLSQDHHKRPVKRSDLSKHAIKGAGKKYDQVMTAVQKKLEEIFGLKLVDLGGTPARYCLINKLKSDEVGQVMAIQEKAGFRQSLLLIILSYIFMMEGTVKEVDLWAFLRILGITIDDPKRHHPIFGDTKKLVVGEFVRQLYLEHSRISGTDPPVMEMSWGPRAHKEFSKKKILAFVSKMYNGIDPQQWTSQWQRAEDDDQGVPSDEED